MTERNPFEHKRALAGSGSLRCEDWEGLLADALDGQLPAANRAEFDAHGAACPVCAELLTQARQGREWLHFLEAEPEVPSGMVERILGKTSGAAIGRPLAAGGGVAAQVPVHMLGLPVRRVGWDTRMVMTIAMAFFSIALTLNVALNLAGVRLTNLKLSDLTPASMEMNLTQQFYGAKKSLVQYYDNLRLVYEVESKMRDLRRNEEMQQSAPPRQQQQQAVPANPSGKKNGGKLEPAVKIPQRGALWGSPELAGVVGAAQGPSSFEQEERETTQNEVEHVAVFCDRVQAGRSLA